MIKLISALFRIRAGLYKEQRGITGIELVVILLAFVGVASLFAIPDLTSKIRRSGGTTQVTREELINDSFAALVLLGGVVGTAFGFGCSCTGLHSDSLIVIMVDIASDQFPNRRRKVSAPS